MNKFFVLPLLPGFFLLAGCAQAQQGIPAGVSPTDPCPTDYTCLYSGSKLVRAVQVKPQVKPETVVHLFVGETAAMGEDRIAFTKVIRDSRCLPGRECIWAGEFLPEITVTTQGKSYKGSSGEIGGYDIMVNKVSPAGAPSPSVTLGVRKL